MSYAAPSTRGYLDARVMTASQPELQLMLLDGAMRFGRQALEHWGNPERRSEADQALRRTVDIVEELVRSATLGDQPESRRLQEDYAFVLRQVALCVLEFDEAGMATALKMLAFHRETWKLAADKLKGPSAIPIPQLDYNAAPQAGFSFQA